MSSGAIVGIVFATIILVFVTIMLILMPCKAYFSTIFSGHYISAFKLIGMKMRKVNVEEIINSYIMSKKLALKISLYDLEVISTSGGHPKEVVEGLVASKNAKNINSYLNSMTLRNP